VEHEQVMQASHVIALAGNPNVGKSTIFNALTGARQHVGNWPGKTVAKKEGIAQIGPRAVTIVDLPGAYSLSAFSLEEIVTRDFLVRERPSAVVAVVDASNLERNLYLVAQVLELRIPVILALNMADVARGRGMKIDARALSARLGGLPVVETVGTRSAGIEQLRQAIDALTSGGAPGELPDVSYGELLEGEINALQAIIEDESAARDLFHPRWLAIKLLENDESVRALAAEVGLDELVRQADAANERILAASGEDAETLITDRRYVFIGEVVAGAVARPARPFETRSDQIDKLLTHRIWGVPLFLLMMWLVFQLTAHVSAPFLDWIDGVVSGPVTHRALAAFAALGLSGSWVEALVVNGVIAGVGGVLVFVPVLSFLYLAITVLEDSGYMARAAFVMDRVMRSIGLHGKSFLPMFVGFGCTVPAVYATRALESEHDRKLTGFLATFMSCGARLPVYVAFGTAFFGARAGTLIFGMYVLGIAIALATGYTLKKTVYRNQPPQPFVLELPPYRLPRARDVGRQMSARVGEFLRKAATVILLCSVVIWLLMALPLDPRAGSFNHVAPKDSIFGGLAGLVAPLFRPAGFDSWETSGSLITGFVAKEVVVSTLSQVYVGTGDDLAASQPIPSWRDDARELAVSFKDAALLTVQELVNIAPRTVNLLPLAHVPQARWVKAGDAQAGDPARAAQDEAFDRVLVSAFSATAGSEARGRLAAVAFNVFVLLYVPCMVTVAAMRQEFGARWTWFQIGYTLLIAWLGAVLVFQGGLLLGIGV